MPTPFPPTTGFSQHPRDVGIHAMDIYFPSTYVSQSALEAYNNIPAGKYTIGLGQLGLAFVNDREDVYSIALSAVDAFMRKYGIGYDEVGRLEVGTETILDHSKSIKSVLMTLFAASGNSDVEGIDSMNACYAGTHALFNSLDWIESSAFDGRYALVVAADIAEYAAGAARPTGGCAAVVILLGPNAPLVVDRGVRATHMEHAWDFYKPNMDSPYPLVDGRFSNSCYLRALDRCYERWLRKYQDKHGVSLRVQDGIDHVVLHAPYNKLTQKAFARLLFTDNRVQAGPGQQPLYPELAAFASLSQDESYSDLALEKQLLALSKPLYAHMVTPGTLIPQHVGNMYTASLYAGLVSLLWTQGKALVGKRVLCFSYGSGLASSIFSLHVPTTVAPSPLTCRLLHRAPGDMADVSTADVLEALRAALDVERRLAARVEKSCDELTACMAKREKLHGMTAFTADDSLDDLVHGAWYLVEKDSASRRQYKRRGAAADDAVVTLTA